MLCSCKNDTLQNKDINADKSPEIVPHGIIWIPQGIFTQGVVAHSEEAMHLKKLSDNSIKQVNRKIKPIA